MHRDMFTQGKFNVRLRQEFRVEHIAPCQSQLETLTQLADLFAGLAVYSRSSYDSYELWQCTCGLQPRLFQTEHESTLRLSSSDRERCQVLASLDGLCKKHRLGVSLKTHRGLRTLRPKSPINFWWYEPQHEADTAPVKDR